MDKIAEKIFKNKKLSVAKAEKAGFDKQNGAFVFERKIVDDQLLCKITFSEKDVKCQIIDLANDLPYTLFLVDSAQGAFVGQVRKEYEKILALIVEACYDENIFKTENFAKINAYIERKYDGKLEFLWEKFPNNAIWRRKDNRKWYAAILTTTKDKICEGQPKEEVELLLLRIRQEELEKEINNNTIFPGYHMNKKHWISVLLNIHQDLEHIYKLIDDSFVLAGKK